MAWTDLLFSFGSLLTSTKMTQMDDNFDSLAAGDAGAPSIQGDAIDTIAESDGSQTISASSTWTPASGVYQIVMKVSGSGNSRLELLISASWRREGSTSGGIFYGDGTNMRFQEVSAASVTHWWQKF